MRRPNARQLHKWLGLPLCVLLFLAALSGILLNHRELLRSVDVPRGLLPSEYSYTNWSGGAVRSALRTATDSYLYGSAGVWRSDSAMQAPAVALNEGLAPGGDERKVMSMAQLRSGEIWLASQFRIYRLDQQHQRWQEQPLPEGLHGRLADLVAHGDSLLLLSRSRLYLRAPGQSQWQPISWEAHDTYTGEITLFRIVWALHSGEYFGLVGRLVVDFIGLVIMLLCLTGIFYTLYKERLKRWKSRKHSPESVQRKQGLMRRLGWHFRWHKFLGKRLIWLTTFVVVTGWVLRPPLMLPLIFNEMRPAGWSELGSDNPWFERLRALRYNKVEDNWLLSTSEGFFMLPASLQGQPEYWWGQPQVSPMGVNVLEQRADSSWVIGSFSGMSCFTPKQDDAPRDYFSGETVLADPYSRPIGGHLIAGAILGATPAEDRVFLYDQGLLRGGDFSAAASFVAQPKELNKTPYSLWQAALELHAGRLYKPFLGQWGTDLFIFFFGLVSVIVLMTGLKRLKPRKTRPQQDSDN